MPVLHSFAELVNFVPAANDREAVESHNSKARAASAQIKEYLLGFDAPVEVTSNEIVAKLGLSHGAVSGFMSRLEENKAAEKVGRKGRQVVFRVDPRVVDTVHVQSLPSRGGKPGRTVEPHSKSIAHLPVFDVAEANQQGGYDLVSALLEAAAYAETLKPSLDDFTTAELIDELHRRAHATEG